jgi:acyl dehydratase
VIELIDVARRSGMLGDEGVASEWIDITQVRLDAYAGAIASSLETAETDLVGHWLALSLLSQFIRTALGFDRVRSAVNCGLSDVRFGCRVHAGSRLRAQFVPMVIDEVDDGVRILWRVTIESGAGDPPCCRANWLVRYYIEQPHS